MTEALDKLLARQAVWHCRETTGVSEASSIASGYARLDEALPSGGWPSRTLIEVLCSDAGIGELRLFMPALIQLAKARSGSIVWVGAPYQPYAPALQQWGLDVSRVLLVQPTTRADTLWATAEALTSTSVIAVLSWLPALDIQESRRLQLAAASGQSLAVTFRPGSARQQTSAAGLRLALQAGSLGTEVDLFKVRGARPKRISDYEGLAAEGSSSYRYLRQPFATPSGANHYSHAPG